MLHLLNTHNNTITHCHKTSYQLIDSEIIFGFFYSKLIILQYRKLL